MCGRLETCATHVQAKLWASRPFGRVLSDPEREPNLYGPKAALPAFCHRRAEWCSHSPVRYRPRSLIMPAPKRHIRGVPIETYVPPDGRPGVFAVGRRCTSCDTLLSRYNPDHRCWVHSPPLRLEERGHRSAPAGGDDFYELLMSEVA